MRESLQARALGKDIPITVDAIPTRSGSVEITIGGMFLMPSFVVSAADCRLIADVLRAAAGVRHEGG